MTTFLLRSVVCAIALTALLAAQPGPRVLPAFTVIGGDSAPRASVALVQAQPWVLVVTQQPCPSCERVLAAIAEAVPPAAGARVAVILSGASAPEAAVVRDRYPHLATYRDDARAVLPALGVAGSPLVLGLSGDRILWTRHVTAMGAANLESLIKSWIR